LTSALKGIANVLFATLRGGVSVCIAVFLFSIALPREVLPSDDSSLINKTKAVFVYNFFNYIKWPVSRDTVTIKVLGTTDIFEPLCDIARIKNTASRTFKIVAIDSVKSIDSCAILFVAKSEEKNIPAIISAIGQKSILTVGDFPGFAKKGIAVNFILIQGKLKFEININALANANLLVNSQLLKLAKIVKER